MDGFHWGGVSRVAVPPPPRPTIGDAVSAAFYGPIREIAVGQGHARTCGIITGENCDCGLIVEDIDPERFEAEMLADGHTWGDLRRSSDQAARGETVTLAEIRDQRTEPG